MENLKGKTAFITGGASGLGLGIAKACAEEGMNVVIADLRQNALDEASQLFKRNNRPVLGLVLDVTDRKSFAVAADEAEAAFGNLHLLINNAGIGCAGGPLWEVSDKEADLAISINLSGVLNGIREIVPRIIKHGEGGHIVSTASKAGLIPCAGFGLYNLTKSAVVAIMETLAEDLDGTNICASVFCPGPHDTSLGKSSCEVTAKLLGEAQGAAQTNVGSAPLSYDNSLTRSPDEAGRRVMRGVKRGDIYILTHVEFKKCFGERVDAIFKAFPDETPDERFYDAFSFLTGHPVFGKQTPVPAIDK